MFERAGLGHSQQKGSYPQRAEQPHRPSDTSAVPLTQPFSGEEHWHPAGAVEEHVPPEGQVFVHWLYHWGW